MRLVRPLISLEIDGRALSFISDKADEADLSLITSLGYEVVTNVTLPDSVNTLMRVQAKGRLYWLALTFSSSDLTLRYT
jgi:hypothetical protein